MKKATFYSLLFIVIGGLTFFAINTSKESRKNDESAKAAINIYFFKNGTLTSVERNISSREDPADAAVKHLLKGPNVIEKTKGYFSEIPKTTRIKNVVRDGDMLKVNFSKGLEQYGGGTARVQALVSQIVYTMTEIKGVKKVQILIDGKKEVSLGSEGYIIDRPLSRDDVSRW